MTALNRIFPDTSALFAGIWSDSGRARLILQLGEAGVVQIVVSSQVLTELENALQRKAPKQLGTVALSRFVAQLGETFAGVTPPKSRCHAANASPLPPPLPRLFQ